MATGEKRNSTKYIGKKKREREKFYLGREKDKT